MAEGLTVSKVVDSQFRRYYKFPQWELPKVVQGHSSSKDQGHDADYHINLNDPGNVMYITKNTGNDGHNSNANAFPSVPIHGPNQAESQSRPNVSHVSPRKWHHGYLRTGLVPVTENDLRHSNQLYMTREDLDNNTPIKLNPVNNQGQITIHYKDLDLVDAIARNGNNLQNKGREKNYKELLQMANNTNQVEKQSIGNFHQLKKEYMDRSRAKEWEYKHQAEKDCSCNDLKNTRTIIRYDIEAPVNGGTQARDIQTHVNNDDNTIMQQVMHVQKDFVNEDKENSSQLGISTSVTLPKFGNGVPRNTRFGSHSKITAYRPSTRLGNHHREKLENIFEFPVHNIDTEEGRKIWEEVDAITKEPLVPPPIPHKRMTYKSRNIHTSNNSVEFFPSFEKEHINSKGTENNIWNDKKEDDHQDNHHIAMEKDARRNILDPSRSPEAINLGNYGRRQIPRGYISPQEEENGYHRMGESISYPNHGGYRQGQNMNALSIPQHTDFNGRIPVTVVANNGSMQPAYASMDQIRMADPRSGNFRLIYPGQQSDREPRIHVPQSGACKGTKLRMTTTLPRITPANTPLPSGVCQSAPPRSHTSASMYGSYPPKDLSSSVDFLKVPGRVNPLAPPPPRKRINWTWETSNQHWENDKRRILMQKREHTRYHSAWSKAFYGAPAEKEAYRSHFRDVLKQQMSDRENSRRDELVNKVKETERAVKYDEQCRSNDAQEYYRKHSYLMLYRDGNKQQMEDKWAQNRFNKVSEDRVDRERLRYNPINWSCSLK